MKKKILAVMLAVLTLSFVLAGCGSGIKEADVSYAGGMVDNLLTSMQQQDYAKFSQDLNDTMKNALNEDSFKTLAATMKDKIGDYQSKTFGGATKTTKDKTEYTTIVYKAKYTKESGDVMITVTFDEKDGKKEISGLFFNSPNLQKK